MTYRIDKDENGEEALIMTAIVRNKTVDLDWVQVAVSRKWRMRNIAICSMMSMSCGCAPSRTVASNSRESGGRTKDASCPFPQR